MGTATVTRVYMYGFGVLSAVVAGSPVDLALSWPDTAAVWYPPVPLDSACFVWVKRGGASLVERVE